MAMDLDMAQRIQAAINAGANVAGTAGRAARGGGQSAQQRQSGFLNAMNNIGGMKSAPHMTAPGIGRLQNAFLVRAAGVPDVDNLSLKTLPFTDASGNVLGNNHAGWGYDLESLPPGMTYDDALMYLRNGGEYDETMPGAKGRYSSKRNKMPVLGWVD